MSEAGGRATGHAQKVTPGGVSDMRENNAFARSRLRFAGGPRRSNTGRGRSAHDTAFAPVETAHRGPAPPNRDQNFSLPRPRAIIRRAVIKNPPTAVDISTVRPAACCSPPAHLDAWVERPWIDGMQVDALHDLDMLFVRTMNTVYEITVVTARTGEAIVRGGDSFPSRPAP